MTRDLSETEETYLSGSRAEGHSGDRAGVPCESAGESAGAGLVHVRLEDRMHRSCVEDSNNLQGIVKAEASAPADQASELHRGS